MIPLPTWLFVLFIVLTIPVVCVITLILIAWIYDLITKVFEKFIK